MIHYHGGPIWPETAAGKIWRNRHGFVSFARPEQIATAAESCATFALDNGAFSFWKSGKETNWPGYYEWVERWHLHPGFDWALIPDVIAGELAENKRLIDDWPLPEWTGVPVWHLHEPLHWLKELCERFPRVAIGSSGEFAQIGKHRWWIRMVEAMNLITDEKGRPPCKLHGLRMLDPLIFTKFPFASCDSTNVALHCMDSARWTTYAPPNNETRGLVLAERIEAQTSLAAWVKRPEQMQLAKAI